MPHFTKLETALIEGALALLGDRAGSVRAQLAACTVVDCDNNGHGFYTTIAIDRSVVPPAPWGSGPIEGGSGYLIGVGESNYLFQSLLWFEDGYLDCLEAYQLGDSHGRTVDLKNFDLSRLGLKPL